MCAWKKVPLFVVAALSLWAAPAPAEQRAGASTAAAAPANDGKVAEAYTQFLLGRHLDQEDDETGAIAAYKRAMELDPQSAEIPGELAALYLRENKVQEAMASAEQALKIGPSNREANRVLGMIYAALVENGQRVGRGRGTTSGGNAGNISNAIHHLELATDGLGMEADPNVRATLARLYIATQAYDKAIPILSTLVIEQPQWQEGPALLAEAYGAAGRNADAINWLEQSADDDPRLLPMLGDFYEREHRWKDAAGAFNRAIKLAPGGSDVRPIKIRYASALLNAGGRSNAVEARDVLAALAAARPDARTLYLLSQAQRRAGDAKAAEDTARHVVEQNAASPWGYYALAEALEARQAYQAVVDTLAPVVEANRGKSAETFDVSLLLPHLGFAYQELGQYDDAIHTFEEAKKLAPTDPSVAGYLVEANLAAKRYETAEELAKAAMAENPDDDRLVRLQAQVLRHAGKADEAVKLLEGSVRAHADDPSAYVALAQMYSDIDRGAEAARLLQDAEAKFPTDNSIVFELGAVYDKQKKYVDAEATFQHLIEKEPENAAALNYLGYMFAERGQRLDESVTLLKKALEIEPDNGSFLDSLGWAYFKKDKLDLAEANLSRAAGQLKGNSVVQDHYAEILFKLGRYDDAIAAWNRALAGDGDSIDRADIDRKIRTAKQKLPKR